MKYEAPAPSAKDGAKTSEYSPSRTLLGAGISFEGNLSGDGEAAIEGKFKGEVNLKGNLIVGSGGHLEANIQAREITVEGKIVGNVVASERVDIRATGVIEGDITTPRVAVAEGATIKGKVNMSPSLKSKEPSAGSPPTAQTKT